MNEGRALVVPTAISLGLRPLAVPGRGPVMVVSSFYAFRISDHACVRPAEWYETVAIHAGPLAIPDSLCPLPGAEVVVLGPAAPVSGGSRPARIECGRAGCSLRLHADPEQPESPVALGPSRACWHADDNPVGRGGPGDDRTPLLVCRGDPDRPMWLGPTPFDHPLRLRCAGTPDVSSGAGWAPDADPAVFFEAHPALRTERLDPGTPVELEGIATQTMRSAIPPYRITLTIGNDDGRFIPAQSRIHTLALIPRAGIGAAFRRSAIDVGDDVMGERIVAVVAALEDAGAEVLICYLPVGAERAVRHYARACLDAGVAMVNCVPVFLASDGEWAERFRGAGLPIVGDDIKSQVGATIVHRTLGRLFADRGVTLDRTYQLNTGGNTDFLNMLERSRLQSKKRSKTESVQSQLDEKLDPDNIHIGPSDYVPWQGDNKVAFIRMEGRGFGDAPLELELRLSVQDSPNSAGVVIDAVRCAKLGLERGLAGPLEGPCAYYMKSPPRQMRDEEARWAIEAFIDGAEREAWAQREPKMPQLAAGTASRIRKLD